MSYELEITATAKEDFRRIAIYIAEESKSKETSLRFVGELRNCCNRLKKFPESGTNPRDRILLSNGYRFIAYKNYLIFYHIEVQHHKVYIDAVFNGKMDYIKVMKNWI